jgi:hypothetical protein
MRDAADSGAGIIVSEPSKRAARYFKLRDTSKSG